MRQAQAARTTTLILPLDLDDSYRIACPAAERPESAEALDALVEGLIEQQDAALGSLMFPLGPDDDAADPNLVKVVVDRFGFALYFSRAEIPYPRNPSDVQRYGHMGIYAWRRERLLEFTAMPRAGTEVSESLEQLRALDAGWKICMVRTEHRPVGVDTPGDLERARRALGA